MDSIPSCDGGELTSTVMPEPLTVREIQDIQTELCAIDTFMQSKALTYHEIQIHGLVKSIWGLFDVARKDK